MRAPKRRLLALTIGLPFSAALLLGGEAVAQPAEDGALVQGTWTIDVSVEEKQPNFDTASGTATYRFGDGCAVGQKCTISREGVDGDKGKDIWTGSGGGFAYNESTPLDCHDTVTGELTTKHGADYTKVARLGPTKTEVRDGVTYATAMSGTIVETIEINAAGRATTCSVDGQGTMKVTQKAVLTGTPLPLPAPPAETSPDPVGVDPATAASAGTLPEFVLPQSDTAADSADAVAAGKRSSVPGALMVPSDALESVKDRLPQDLLLVAVLGLLIIFPAQIFNSTYEENRERIERPFRRFRRRSALAAVPAAIALDQPPQGDPGDPAYLGDDTDATVPESDAGPPRRVRRLGLFLLCALVGTMLGGLLDPEFGVNRPTAALLAGVLIALLVAVLVVAAAGWLFRAARRQPHNWYLRAVPSALIVAVLCVVVSRLTNFAPGYLFGLLGGAVFAGVLARRTEGRAEFVTLLSALVLALLAWVAFEQVVARANEDGAQFGVLVADSFLGCLFIGGVEGLLFSLIPLRFLPGSRVRQWGWLPWAGLVLVTAYLFVHVLLIPEAGYLGRSTTVTATVTIGLFAAFGVLSLVFWAWFRFRPDPASKPAPAVEPVGTDTVLGGPDFVDGPVVVQP